MWKAYKVDGLQVMIEQPDGQGGTVEVPGVFTYELLNRIDANIKIDITPKSPYDRFAQEQSIEGLMQAGIITFEEYVEALPEDSVMPKYILEDIIKKRKEKQAIIDQMSLAAEQMQAGLEQSMMQKDQTMSDIERIHAEGNNMQQGLANAMGV